MNPGGDNELWARRLRQEFRLLRKTPHGFATAYRHPTVRQEWIARIIRQPYDRWVEVDPESGEERTILAGRVPEFGQWIELVLVGSVEDGLFHTAYRDRQLAKKYGGRPWPCQS